jgi:hypothetical protein
MTLRRAASSLDENTDRISRAFAFIHMMSGFVKPIFERRSRFFSGIRPFIALRYTARFQPPLIFWSMGSEKMNSTSS